MVQATFLWEVSSHKDGQGEICAPIRVLQCPTGIYAGCNDFHGLLWLWYLYLNKIHKGPGGHEETFPMVPSWGA